MDTRQTWIIGLAALGLALAIPVHAAPDYLDDAYIVAQRDRGDEARQDRRDARKPDQRRAPRREAERNEPQGYGYGYERRQQERPGPDSRPRGRR
ncbi:MAG: hypothetical protein BGO60_03830 [Thiobacillus sp. 65-1059]|nr:MAG: hypothetical protein BGO60_03830 [Thiobacillus sp. 65-1059]